MSKNFKLLSDKLKSKFFLITILESILGLELVEMQKNFS